MDEPKRFFDVSKPGAASPSGRPVIVSNKPVQDPMMSQLKPEVQVTPLAPVPDHAIAQSAVSPQTDVSPAVNAQPVAEPLHKFAHQEAFYGHVGKRPRGKKVLLFIVLAVIFAAGGYGAWMYRKNQDKKASQAKAAAAAIDAAKNSSVSKPKPTKIATKYSYVVPEGYSTYTDKISGFSFAYPKQFGTTTTDTDLTDGYTNKVVKHLRTTSLEQTKSLVLGVAGRFDIYSYAAKTSEITGRKYGPQIKLQGQDWVVVTASEGDVIKNKVGAAYLDFSSKKPVVQKNGDLSVYSLVSGDEGVENLRLAFVTDTLHVISLPSFDSGSYGNAKVNDPATYRAMVKVITDSITAL